MQIFCLLILAFIAPISAKESQILSMDFTRTKIMGDITFESTGSLMLWSGHGLIWDVKTPFASKLIITRKGIFQSIAGTFKQLNTGQGTEVTKTIADIIEDLFANAKLLTKETWQTKGSDLLKAHKKLTYIMKDLKLEGGSFIEKLTMCDKNGGLDTLTFFNHKILEKPIASNAEKKILLG